MNTASITSQIAREILQFAVENLRGGAFDFVFLIDIVRRPRWPRGLRRRSTAARSLGLRVRIPQGAWMSVTFECCVLSGRGLFVGLITRLEEFYLA